jgi:F0F1-type ATP synthase membrane subunit b/b'
MDETLHALAGILLGAIPTVVLLFLLHFYIKRMFFRPLEKVLDERYQATEGTRRVAEATFARAAQKAAECEAALRATRAEIYREVEEQRRKWREEHGAAIAESRGKAGEAIQAGKAQLAADAAAAKQSLEASSEALAARIAESVFQERVN